MRESNKLRLSSSFILAAGSCTLCRCCPKVEQNQGCTKTPAIGFGLSSYHLLRLAELDCVEELLDGAAAEIGEEASTAEPLEAAPFEAADMSCMLDAAEAVAVGEGSCMLRVLMPAVRPSVLALPWGVLLPEVTAAGLLASDALLLLLLSQLLLLLLLLSGSVTSWAGLLVRYVLAKACACGVCALVEGPAAPSVLLSTAAPRFECCDLPRLSTDMDVKL